MKKNLLILRKFYHKYVPFFIRKFLWFLLLNFDYLMTKDLGKQKYLDLTFHLGDPAKMNDNTFYKDIYSSLEFGHVYYMGLYHNDKALVTDGEWSFQVEYTLPDYFTNLAYELNNDHSQMIFHYHYDGKYGNLVCELNDEDKKAVYDIQNAGHNKEIGLSMLANNWWITFYISQLQTTIEEAFINSDLYKDLYQKNNLVYGSPLGQKEYKDKYITLQLAYKKLDKNPDFPIPYLKYSDHTYFED